MLQNLTLNVKRDFGISSEWGLQMTEYKELTALRFKLLEQLSFHEGEVERFRGALAKLEGLGKELTTASRADDLPGIEDFSRLSLSEIVKRIVEGNTEREWSTDEIAEQAVKRGYRPQDPAKFESALYFAANRLFKRDEIGKHMRGKRAVFVANSPASAD